MVYFEDIRLTGGLFVQQGKAYSGEHDIHIHDVLEIGVVTSGKVRYQFGHEAYEGEAGDVFICRPFTPHWGYNLDEQAPCEWILILFTPSVAALLPGGKRLIAPFYTLEDSEPVIRKTSPYAVRIHQLALAAADAEYGQAHNPVGETKKYICLMDILMNIYEYINGERNVRSTEVPDHPALHAVTYLLEHHRHAVDIGRLIGQSGWGKTLFYREFKKLTGLTPNQFVHRLRLQTAVDLLLTTDRSITDIAYESGYESLTTFHNHFNKQYGQAPGTFRSAARTF